MNRTRVAAALLAAAVPGVATRGAAQSVDTTVTRPVFAIGQPLEWRQHAALAGTVAGPGGASLSYGVYHPFSRPPSQAFDPVLGILGSTLEAYASSGASGDAGVRALATSRLLATSVGADWDVRNHRVDAMLSWQSAIRRGGLLGGGTMLRVDWIPRRHGLTRIGVFVPLFQPLAGRTRPRDVSAGTIPATVPPGDAVRALRAADGPPARSARNDSLARTIEGAARAIVAYSDLWTEDAVRASRALPYATAMQQSRDALGQLLGDAAAQRARTAVLDRILIPVDSLFGRVKRVEMPELIAAADADFARWLRDSSGVAAPAQGEALRAFDLWLGAVAAPLRETVARTRDTRLLWFPLDLALTLDQFDDQVEVDSLIGRVVGRPFSDHNALTYMRSTDLPLEIARSIYAARAYHVLWTHEFMGRLWESRAIDDVGYQMVADAYLPAMTAAVKRYDSTGVFPVYLILHDQFYYEISDGRLWLSILADPLHASMRLPGDDGHRERHLRERQAELRAAVAASARLQRDARASGDPEGWLRRVVRVSVNVGNQSDFSFRSSHIIPGLPFAPDNLMRDHRKLVLYDVDEAHPYRGAVFVMGIGIGELYASSSWEDRGFRVRGPAALEARAALRRALVRNGFSEAEIPVPLREVGSVSTQERANDDQAFVGRALQVHNEVGFGDKKSSVARALLYSLAQPGSVIIAPDQLWMSETWGGMLAGAAARGAHVHVIAPAQANAPIPDALAMARAHDVLLRLITLRDELGATMRAAGGDLRVGLFAAHAGADDAAGRLREVRAGLARYPWIREVIPFQDSTLAVLDRVERQVASDGRDATSMARDEDAHAPQPHRKTQIVARPGAIAALVRAPGWDRMLADAMRVQSAQTAKFADQLGYTEPAVDSAATRQLDDMMRAYEASIPAAERRRVSMYFSEGSHNMDQRGLMSDGEAILIVSGPQAYAGLVDLFYMMARSTWVDDRAGLERLLPPHMGFVHRVARWLRATL